ncbi:TonB-dependent receptor [Hymenobacter roseosalivarius DSM 11622]|uniref:TonB-dependent receptor n=1 Tax=Hymenobacter roseosalivarius DSM 11622 TaxID=645990 RepID=A0A1W1W0N6_9BACT|nr:TonB-dependent receptor [Hymenobacter roseosalivarius]SMB99158.1 TonB-dependent receptor [Hymenobacter roseosalivarius DSM 11622]
MKSLLPLTHLCRQLVLALVPFLGLAAPAAAADRTEQSVLEQHVTLQVQEQPVLTALASLENQVHTRFLYSPQLIGANRKVTVQAVDTPLSGVLQSLFGPLQITYEVVNSGILLAPLPLPKTAVDATITGRVTSEGGEAIPGATVLELGTNNGISTDGDGRFSITVKPGATLVVSAIGFKSQQIAVGDRTTLDVRLQSSTTELGQVTVVGSRGLPRTDVERPAPVDVLNAKELQATGQVDLGQQVQFNSPSFNSAKTGVNGVANYADPATLRGLSPDQVLVLVDGKRRHQFSALNLNVTVGSGTVVTDLNAVPSLAIERIEVLRDGAAAQYGSDAIAGVINLGLNKSTGVATIRTQFGVTQEGDGTQYLAGANYGVKLGKTNPGYLNLTLQYQRQNQTDRSDNYVGGIYTAFPALTAANPTPTPTQIANENRMRAERGVYPPVGEPFKVGVYGSNQADIYQGFYNLGVPVGSAGWSVYSFGGYSRKDILAYGFFRNAQPNNVNYSPIHPDGYLPELPGRSDDYSAVVGLNRKLAGGWNLDFSTGYGHNYLDLFANKTANPSLGNASPTDFYVGRSAFGQSTSEVNVSRNYVGLFGTKSFNLALGSQFRVDRFELEKGSPASYEVGPFALAAPATPTSPARTAKAPGSSGRPGIAPDDETNTTRSNIGVYVDVESDITERLLVTSALRYENYSDFGSNISGKLASRMKLTEGIALRGSINRGFRAPSLQQTFNSVSTSTVQAGAIVQTKQLRNNDPRLVPLGVADPKAETSWNYSLGVAARLTEDLLFTVDAYQIDIQDRIINSERLVKSDIRALQTPDFANISEIRFFTNAIDTRTRGIDLVTTYKYDISDRSRLSTSLALTFNATNIVRTSNTPAELQAGTTNRILLIDTVSIGLIEQAQPRQKVLFSVTYQVGKFSLTPRASYFGPVTAYEKPANRVVSGATVYVPHISQKFEGKTLFDLALVYTPVKAVSVSVGANNLTNVYPDRVDAARFGSYSNGEIPYSRNVAQFGFNGAYYYTNVTLTF